MSQTNREPGYGHETLPESPVTEMAGGAAALHELKCVYIEAGFTNAEAM